MKAAVYTSYGPADVVTIADVARPEIGANEILVAVHATTVTTADWRIRASAFPTYAWLPGRIMFGLFKPKKQILGTEFAGRVVSVGEKVTRFKVGDRVFGFSGDGAHAEYVKVTAEGPVALTPDSIADAEAAAVPFGGLSALVFLRDVAKVRKGERILIPGASGGVGVYLVQLAKHFGADVTAVTSTTNRDLVAELGADRVIDYTREDMANIDATYDVIVDPVGKTTFRRFKKRLAPGGRHVFLEFGFREILQALWTGLIGSRKVKVSVSGDSREDLEYLADLMARGEVRPVIDGVMPLDSIADAHRRVESRHKTGSLVIEIAKPADMGATPATVGQTSVD